MAERKIKTLVAVAAGLIPAAASLANVPSDPSHRGRASQRRPNVIFILMDDAGYGDFGCYGQQKTETPNIDALAAHGITFTDMYAGAPVSAASRCGLLTGLHSGHAQIRSNDEQPERGEIWNYDYLRENPDNEGQAPMAEGTFTIGTMMQQSGYRTGMFGKWGLGGPSTVSVPKNMGFDTFYGYLCQRMAQCYYPPYLYDNCERVDQNNPHMLLGDRLDDGADPYDPHSYAKFKGNTYSADIIYDKLLEFIRDNRKREFFAMWTTTIPHSALQAPDEYVQRYVRKFGDEEPIYRNATGYFPCRYPKATYAAMITYFDNQVGQLITELKRMGLYDNTIIIFTSDNGPTHNAYTNTLWFDSAHPFRSDRGWVKRSLHEGGIREPFIVSWGDRLERTVSDHIGYLPDVMPTLCEIAGSECPETDGISFMPTIRNAAGASVAQPEHEFLYWEFPPFRKERGWLSVRMGQWKGLVLDVADGGNDMLLYDITADPRETTDLAAEHPEIVRVMWEHIRESHEDVENPNFKLQITYPVF